MKMNAIIFLIPESNKWRLERPPTQWKRYFTRYLTKSGAPDIVPFLKKTFLMADPKPRGMKNICLFMEVPVYTRKGVVVFNYKFQLDTPKDLLFICLTIASTVFYPPEI